MSDFLKGKFDNQEIWQRLFEHKYSSGFKPSNELVESIVDQFWFHDFYNSFVSDPIFLKYLIKYLNYAKPRKFSRFDFYQFVFNQLIRQADKRNLIQLIAVTFEQLQTDTINTTDYRSLLKKIESPNDTFSLSWMQKKHLAKIVDKDGNTYFTWEHHTLTEFLTAEYILQAINPLGEFQKFALLNQEGVLAFKPSWSGVLRFLLESPRHSEAFQWLISLLDQHKDNVDDNLSELVSFIDIDIPSQLSKKIFNLIYDSYFNRIVWLPVWARRRIAKFVDEESYKRLKQDIKQWSNTTETFVRRSNVISIVEGLLDGDSKLLSHKEKQFWKNKLIEFAINPEDEGNGVLQRHCLAALAYFKDDKIITLVAQKCFEETRDSLLRDEFIQFCINTAPNSKPAITYFIKGVKTGSTIYARHGLYKITTREAIEYFLSIISKDEEFLKSFLEHESIFDKEGADRELIKNIKNCANPEIIKQLKVLIFTVLRIDNFYKEDQSNFLQQTVRLIGEYDPKYLFEILDDIKKEKVEQKIDRLFYDSKELLAPLLTKDNIKQYFKSLEYFPDRTKRDAQYPVYIAKRINGITGNRVYQESVRLDYIKRVDEDRSQADFEEQQKKKLKEIYDSFIRQLEPEPGKYMPGVFEYFSRHRKEIEEFWQKRGKKRLLKLAIDEGIKKISPKEFKVTIPDKKTRQFSWSSVASYYGEVLSLVKIFAPREIQKHRQNIIDFIPYAFSDDMSLILDLIQEVKDEELSFVNNVMSNPRDDRRYLVPGSYIYLVGQYVKKGCTLNSVKPVLLSFLGDKNIPDYEQRAALENLAFFVNDSDKKTKAFLKNIFEKSEDKELSKTANSLLISVYKDEDSINWRFVQLKTPIEFDRRKIEGIEHSVGSEEIELDSLAFAKPLIELQDDKYLPKFFDLLSYSFKVIGEKRDKKYWDYVNYLWRIVIAFVENLKEKGSFKPLLTLEKWVSKNATDENSNWLNARINELRKVYINSIGKTNP